MILTIPFNPNLPGGYDRLINALLRNGKHPNHTLIVLAKQEHEDPAFDFAMKLREHFGSLIAKSIPSSDTPRSAVAESNTLFLTALEALRTYVPGDHEMQEPAMLYFDPTWRPTKTRWLDEFNTEFYLAGVPTTYGYFKEDKPLGPVVLKQDFLTKSKLLEFLPGAGTHWRDYLAWEIINNGVNAEALGRTLPAFIRPFDTRYGPP